MHFYSLQDLLKRHSSSIHEELSKVYSHSKDMKSLLDEYIPYTGDIHERDHLKLSYQVHLVRARLFTLDAELQKLINMLNK